MIIPLMTQRKRDHFFGPFCSSQIIPHYVPLQGPGLSLLRMAHNFHGKEKEIQHIQVKFQDREKWVSLIFDLRLETFWREK
jgi:hypothetical protein